MARKPKTGRVPRTRAGGDWTEAQFWSFVRSNLRAMSIKWPPRRQCMQEGRRPYTGPNRRQKWEYQCHDCGFWFSAKEIELDHVDGCGSLKSWDDVGLFLQRMLCEVDGYRRRCKECHHAKTQTENTERRILRK